MTKSLTLDLPTEKDTAALGRALSGMLKAGDALLLQGSIGTGKSHLARAFIRARLGQDTEVPSPTFTLVQTYPGTPDIWHADLYRLTHPDEVAELGLEDAFQSAICLIEWPDRLGSCLPANPVRLILETIGEGRRATLTSGDRPGFNATLLRYVHAEAFVDAAGWRDADRQPLAVDASTRRYERLSLPGQKAILMDAPPGQVDSAVDFAKIDRHLQSLGISAPKIFADDSAHGYLLLEDLGDALYPTVIAANPALEPKLYAAATDVLLRLQASPPAPDLSNLSAQHWAEAAAFAVDWYRLGIVGNSNGRADFVSALAETLEKLASDPPVMILRDYHAENLLWLPEREGIARVGVLDFQLAQMGQPAYDLVSLLQDARRDVPPEIEAAMIQRFAAATGTDPGSFGAGYAALGAQRALRILGIFARLCLAEGKTRYIALIPRIWTQLQRNLAHPALAKLRMGCARLLPEPTPATLLILEGRCSAFR